MAQGSGGSRSQGRGGPLILHLTGGVLTVAAEADTTTRGASLDRRESSSSQV